MVLALVAGLLPAAVFAKGNTEEDGNKPVTIVYWQYFFQSKVELMDQLITEFEAKNPGIKVEHVHFPYENYNQKVASSIPVGTGPDVLNLFYGWMPLYVKSGYIQALPPARFNQRYFDENFFPFVGESVRFNRQFYAIPTAVRTLSLIWNKKLFREAGLNPDVPPKTLAELRDYAKKLSKYDTQGNLIQAGLAMQPNKQGHNWIRDILIRQFGGVPYSDGGLKVAYNTPAGAAALKWYTDMITVDRVGYPNFSTDDATAFAAQKAAMNIEGSFRIAALNAVKDLEWAAAELPVHNGVKSNYASFWANAISAGVTGKKLEASIKFLEFLASPDVQNIWMEKVGELPANPAFAAKQLNKPQVGEFLKGLEYAHASVFVDEMGQRDLFVNMVDQVVLNNVSPANALKEAAEKEQKIIDQFWK
jgi:multiple sugar transport system substrate-binding protein